jgi:hypothetical protein
MICESNRMLFLLWILKNSPLNLIIERKHIHEFIYVQDTGILYNAEIENLLYLVF